eukprot:Rhum_TRINITY_DN11681_c0_g1::Rhum_TRINITY_DN11681_c0_g1_i1::g.46118::m.46118
MVRRRAADTPKRLRDVAAGKRSDEYQRFAAWCAGGDAGGGGSRGHVDGYPGTPRTSGVVFSRQEWSDRVLVWRKWLNKAFGCQPFAMHRHPASASHVKCVDARRPYGHCFVVPLGEASARETAADLAFAGFVKAVESKVAPATLVGVTAAVDGRAVASPSDLFLLAAQASPAPPKVLLHVSLPALVTHVPLTTVRLLRHVLDSCGLPASDSFLERVLEGERRQQERHEQPTPRLLRGVVSTPVKRASQRLPLPTSPAVPAEMLSPPLTPPTPVRRAFSEPSTPYSHAPSLLDSSVLTAGTP